MGLLYYLSRKRWLESSGCKWQDQGLSMTWTLLKFLNSDLNMVETKKVVDG